MARQLRIEFPGACYHVLNRGVEKRTVFLDSRDYLKFLALFGELRSSSGIILHAYCLMPNHYHLVIQTPGSGLKRFMQSLNSRYARHFNDRYDRVGPLFQGRYRSLVVETDARFRTLVRYVHRNPVAAGLCGRAGDWRWSSCGAYLGLRSSDAPLERALVEGLHGSTRAAARDLMRSELDRPGDAEAEWRDIIKAGAIAGSAEFVQVLQRAVIPSRGDGTISRLRELRRPPAEVVTALSRRIAMLGLSRREARPVLIYALHRSTSLTEREIARMVGLSSPMAVGQVIWRTKARRARDAGFAGKLGRLDAMLRGVKP